MFFVLSLFNFLQYHKLPVKHMVAEENMEFWVTVLFPFPVGATTVLLLVLLGGGV